MIRSFHEHYRERLKWGGCKPPLLLTGDSHESLFPVAMSLANLVWQGDARLPMLGFKTDVLRGSGSILAIRCEKSSLNSSLGGMENEIAFEMRRLKMTSSSIDVMINLDVDDANHLWEISEASRSLQVGAMFLLLPERCTGLNIHNCPNDYRSKLGDINRQVPLVVVAEYGNPAFQILRSFGNVLEAGRIDGGVSLRHYSSESPVASSSDDWRKGFSLIRDFRLSDDGSLTEEVPARGAFVPNNWLPYLDSQVADSSIPEGETGGQ